MSKVGKIPVSLPKGVAVTVADGTVTCKGPKGELSVGIPDCITITVDAAAITLARKDDGSQAKTLHGTTRALVRNMVEGVSTGYARKLEVVGVGYRAQLQGSTLSLNVGFANTIIVEVPAGIQVKVPDATHIEVSGIDKQLVGQTAAVIRAARKPEPYKGKGVRYEGEAVRRKAGKSAAKGKK
jgi:large subunit ribosomal protein L6